MSEVKLTAVKRTEFGKGAARRLRREQQVPAVIYGHGTDPVHVALPGHATMMALKQHNALFALEVEGGAPVLALPKAVQRDPVRGTIEHVDMLIVRRGEKVTVDIGLHVVGDPISGTLVTNELVSLSVEVEATTIPNSLEVSIAGATAGTVVHAKDVALPAGAVLITDPDAIVVQVTEAGASSGAEGADSAAEAAAE